MISTTTHKLDRELQDEHSFEVSFSLDVYVTFYYLFGCS